MSDVLVLNRNFFAIQITSWQRAFALMYTDHARVVDTAYRTYSFNDWKELSKIIDAHPAGFIQTPAFKIAIPEVIALRLYDKLPRMDVKFTRRNIYEHYKYQCCYCGSKFASSELNLEHVVPRSRGGKSTWDNVVTSCIACNLRKGNKLLKETSMKLLTKPSKPRWHKGISLVLKPNVRLKASWQKFVDTMYWNTELQE